MPFKHYLAAALIPAALATAQQPATLSIDTTHPTAAASPTLYGLMTEEINYSYDGGLYPEMVSNRAFKNNRGPNLNHWTVVQQGISRASISPDKTTGPSTALSHSLKLTVDAATPAAYAGIANDGFWGYPLRPATTYRGSLYAKSDTPTPITIRLIDDNTAAILASTTVPDLTTAWQQHTFTLKTPTALKPTLTAHLEISVQHPGTLWFSLVSLFPPTYKDRPNGFRIDLMEKLAAMHPAFLRFPGGNYLEGDRIDERFDWKKTIGPLVDRPTHPSPWKYQSSDGLGLLEFLNWCEDLHMQPLLAVYAGYSLLGDRINPSPDLEPYVQDALDEIEYVTGSTSTKWGAERAKNGHPDPFHLTYIEIGNEDQFDKSHSYDGRFAQFYKAIKQRYPALQIIATTPVQGTIPDLVDDHYYRSAEQFFSDVHHYDKTDRNGPKIFVGEWATREGSPTTNFGAALGDAAWMTGMERNSDLVVIASYAPLFVNVNPGGMQWASDLIGYDALNSYGSPSYYAQAMFGSLLGDQILPSALDTSNPRIFQSVTLDSKRHHLILKLVNASSISQLVEIKLTGASHVQPKAAVTTLSAPTPQTTNSITDPTRIIPISSTINTAAPTFTHTLPRYSIQVLDLNLN